MTTRFRLRQLIFQILNDFVCFFWHRANPQNLLFRSPVLTHALLPLIDALQAATTVISALRRSRRPPRRSVVHPCSPSRLLLSF
jgi:hypothetical protein